jgi:hypothetical protein
MWNFIILKQVVHTVTTGFKLQKHWHVTRVNEVMHSYAAVLTVPLDHVLPQGHSATHNKSLPASRKGGG